MNTFRRPIKIPLIYSFVQLLSSGHLETEKRQTYWQYLLKVEEAWLLGVRRMEAQTMIYFFFSVGKVLVCVSKGLDCLKSNEFYRLSFRNAV